MSIKAHTPTVTVKFGKTANIGAIIERNREARKPVLILVPINKTKHGAKINEADIKQDETKVVLEFASPKSIDVVITQLEKMKHILIQDYAAKLGAELHNKLDAFVNGD